MEDRRVAFLDRPVRVLVLALALVLSLAACAQAGETGRALVADVPEGAEQHYYAIEADGTLFGYAHVVSHPTEVDGREVTLQRQKMLMLVSALGAEVDIEMDLTYHIDPATGMYTYTGADVIQGPSQFHWEARIEGSVAYLTSTLGGKDRAIELPDDVVLAGTLYFPHLKRDFVDRGLDERSYATLDVRDAEVRRVDYTRAGREALELAGRTYDTVVLDERHEKTGIRLKIWLDEQTGQIVQADLPNERRIYLSEPRVVRKIEVANLDESLTSKVGVLIADFQNLTHMKVRAVFEPTGLRLTPAALNVPGQKFTGTVEGNRVEGVFEIAHARYDGAGAPPFPPDFRGDASLHEYLEPAELIESDDPVLIDKARELTAGAVDSWDAARRLSNWVAENIDYAIPGGGTARRTYDLRAGECGSHSVLVAALCRAVGIPARLVWGCQYVPSFGGAFGQHGWNEVYMGAEAGWVPLDATSFEPDYVDSGHIRIGDYRSAATALNPVEMEVLEYRLGAGEIVRPGAAEGPAAATPDPAVRDRYAPYVGRYTHVSGKIFEARVEDGRLVIDIEGEVALPLHDPDSEGIWRCKLTPHVYVTFDREGPERATGMSLHEVVRMRRTGDLAEIDPSVPQALRSHLGTYLLAARNTEFVVAWRSDSLAIRDTRTPGGFTRLEEDPDQPGTWVSTRTGNRITFQTDAQDQVEQLTVNSRTHCERG